MKRYQNILLILAVVALGVFPLWYVPKHVHNANGETVEIFAGADDKAKNLVRDINPNYTPWFESLMEPSSGEIASLLFALQEGIGAGFIGYYLGGVGYPRQNVSRSRKKRNSKEAANEC